MYKVVKTVLNSIILHAENSFPNECCGLLAGNSFTFTKYYPLTNESKTPQKNYLASPKELFQTFKQIRTSGQELLGIYHSHPNSIAYPSITDINLAFYPEAVYFIFSIQQQRLAAFHIKQENVISIDFEVV